MRKKILAAMPWQTSLECNSRPHTFPASVPSPPCDPVNHAVSSHKCPAGILGTDMSAPACPAPVHVSRMRPAHSCPDPCPCCHLVSSEETASPGSRPKWHDQDVTTIPSSGCQDPIVRGVSMIPSEVACSVYRQHSLTNPLPVPQRAADTSLARHACAHQLGLHLPQESIGLPDL